jgi:hypothetical protein
VSGGFDVSHCERDYLDRAACALRGEMAHNGLRRSSGVYAALALVGCGFCRDGAGDAGINRLDAPKLRPRSPALASA